MRIYRAGIVAIGQQLVEIVRDANESASLLQKILMLLTRLILALDVKPAYFILSTPDVGQSGMIHVWHVDMPASGRENV